MKFFKYIFIFVLFMGNILVYSQEVDLDKFNQELKDEKKVQKNKTIDTNGKYQIITGMGFQHLNWNYNVNVPESASGGATVTLKESSDYNGLDLFGKFVMYRPFGMIAKLDFFIPLSITETIIPSTTGNGTRVVTGTVYVLKNIADDQSKGFGFEILVGPNYEVKQNNFSVNIGGGLAWNSFFEDFSKSNRSNTSIGFGLDADMQIHFKKYFGLSIGLVAEYYPFSIIDANNKVSFNNQSYTLATSYLLKFGASIGTAWYF